MEVQSALGLLLFEYRNRGIIAGSLNGESEEGSAFMMASDREASCTPDERE